MLGWEGKSPTEISGEIQPVLPSPGVQRTGSPLADLTDADLDAYCEEVYERSIAEFMWNCCNRKPVRRNRNVAKRTKNCEEAGRGDA